MHSQKKMAFILSLFMVLVISLTACSTTPVSSSAAPVNSSLSDASSAPVEGGENVQAGPLTHDLSAIVDPSAEWEKVCAVEGGIFIEGLNFAKNGQLWFVDVAGHRIYTYEDGEVKVVLEDESLMPNGAKFIDDVTLLIVDRLAGIYTFNTETYEREALFTDFNGTPFLGLNDVALDGKGGAYITDAGSASTTNNISRVYYMTLGDTPALSLFESGVAYANGIACTPDGERVYIAEFSRNQLLTTPATPGRETTRVFARFEGGVGPDGVETDKDGNVYIAHLEAGEVIVIAPDGIQYGAIRLPEGAGIFLDNLTFHEGYMYVCEAGQSIIWRIPLKANIE